MLPIPPHFSKIYKFPDFRSFRYLASLYSQRRPSPKAPYFQFPPLSRIFWSLGKMSDFFKKLMLHPPKFLMTSYSQKRHISPLYFGKFIIPPYFLNFSLISFNLRLLSYVRLVCP